MPLIPYVEPEEASPEVKAFYQKIGKPANLHRIIANSPGIFAGYMELRQALNTSALEPRLRVLACLATSKANGCHY